MEKIKISSLEKKLRDILRLDTSEFYVMSNAEMEREADKKIEEQLKTFVIKNTGEKRRANNE